MAPHAGSPLQPPVPPKSPLNPASGDSHADTHQDCRAGGYPEIVILALVAEVPRYGYEIAGEIHARGLDMWGRVPFSSIYYILGKLERIGLVTVEYQKEGRYPTRKVYSITPAGRDFLKIHLSAMIGIIQPATSPQMLGISFLHVLPKETALKALGHLIAEMDKRGEFFAHWSEEMLRRYPLPTTRLVMRTGRENMERVLANLRELYKELVHYPWERWTEDFLAARLIEPQPGEESDAHPSAVQGSGHPDRPADFVRRYRR